MAVEEKNKFGNLWTKIKDTAIDLATVDVTTLEGNVKLKLKGDDLFTPDKLFANLKLKIDEPTSELTLVAHTHVDFDLDAVMVSKPDPSDSLIKAHNEAVKTALDARMAVMRLAKDLIT